MDSQEYNHKASEIMSWAIEKFGHQAERDASAHYEHGQWWLIWFSGRVHSVVECETETGTEYLDFEEVSQGEEEN